MASRPDPPKLDPYSPDDYPVPDDAKSDELASEAPAVAVFEDEQLDWINHG
jgi:hypothetical protein